MPGTGRRRRRSASAAATCCREREAGARLANGRVNGEGRATGWWIGGAAGRGWGADVGRRRELWQHAPRSEAGTVGGRSIGLSPVNFVGWEWADGRYFNFHLHSLRPMNVTYLMPAHTSRQKLTILRRLLDKPTKVIVADRKFSSYSGLTVCLIFYVNIIFIIYFINRYFYHNIFILLFI
jgi:hypothetical protein